jgi:hypothetical protein
MLTPGNKKLGGHLIWGFGLPSGTAAVCVGMTPTCRTHCYAIRTEVYRRTAARRYRRNLVLSRRRDFARRVRAFIVAQAVRVVRIHTGGDFYSPRYARKWLAVMRRCRRTRFFFYTRAWRVPAIRRVIDQMAALPNCRVWLSCDVGTGLAGAVPPGVRTAWLMTEPGELPPSGTHLVFRVRHLRSRPAPDTGPCVCPAEDGIPRPRGATCDRCGYCWRPLPPGRIPLVVIEPDRESPPTAQPEGR